MGNSLMTKQKVLIIDRQIDLFNSLQIKYPDLDYEFESDAAKTLAKTTSTDPDLILFDSDFDSEHAFDLCRQLKVNEITEAIPIILLSQHNDTQSKVNGLEAGATDYLVKPIIIDELIARIQAALRSKTYQDVLIGRGQIDTVTGLWNRKHFDARLHEELSIYRRYRREFSILMVEVNDLSKIQNTGEAKAIIRAAGELIWMNARTSDIACRLFGGRFAVLLPETPLHQTNISAERLLKSGKKLEPYQDGTAITLNIGIVSSDNIPTTTLCISRILGVAERVLQESQQAGVNQIAKGTLCDFLADEKQLSKRKDVEKPAQPAECNRKSQQMALIIRNHERLQDFLKSVLNSLKTLFNTHHGFILLSRPGEDDKVYCEFATGCFSTMKTTSFTKSGWIQHIFTTNSVMEINSADDLTLINHAMPDTDLNHLAIIPINLRDIVVGCVGLTLDPQSKHAFAPHEIELLSPLSHLFSISLESVNKHDEMHNEFLLYQQREQEHKRARCMAESANHAKNGFLENLGFELKNPMQTIIEYTEFLIEDLKDDPNQEHIEDLNKILDAGKHMHTLVNNVVDLSTLEAGNNQLYVEEFELQNFLDNIAQTINPHLESNGNLLKCEYSEVPKIMRTDRSKLRQILSNLLTNANQFTTKGEITLDVFTEQHKHSEWVRFCVCDTGVGIDHLRLDGLFKQTAQNNDGSSQSCDSKGLGLVISKSFCEMMGGAIEVTSEKGKGSRFSFVIPSNMPISTHQSATDYCHFHQDDKRTLLLFAATDELELRLRIKGITIYWENTMSNLMEVVHRINPDVIIVDPCITKSKEIIDALYQLKIEAVAAFVPIIILCDNPDLAKKIREIDAGKIDFVSKPIDLIELKARVKAVLRNKYFLEFLVDQTQVDTLTKLRNQTYFLIRVKQETAVSRRYNRNFSLIKLAIDNFNVTTKKKGSFISNKILRMIATLLLDVCRDCDIPCRTGESDFSVILPETSDEQAIQFMSRFKQGLQKRLQSSETKNTWLDRNLTVSMGYASTNRQYNRDTMTPEAIAGCAELALFEAIENGGNKAYFCDEQGNLSAQ